jgi:hypothetical protein
MTPITVNMTSLTGAVNSLIEKKRNNLLPKKNNSWGEAHGMS